MAGPTAVLGRSLIVGALAVLATADRYQLSTNTFVSEPNTTISLTSAVTCALFCTGMRCGSFTYHDGSCHLFDFLENPACPECPIPAPEVNSATDVVPLSYVRQQFSGCPGMYASFGCQIVLMIVIPTINF